jgi:hypothetical protein
MSTMTDYLADAIRDHVLMNTTYTSPTTVYLALFTTATTEAGGGTEVTGGSYARQAITFSAGADAGLAEQSGSVAFATMPACTVVNIAVFDASTTGNMLFHGRLPTARVVSGGATFDLNSGDLRILID